MPVHLKKPRCFNCVYSELFDALFEWYTRHGRHDLPWRQTRDAYAIYVSEIMLQQTQVTTVKERFYRPFLEAFPSIEALSHASLDAVLKQWEGLGYYRRARHLHEAARAMAPSMPTTIEGLLAMKGVGKSTAHAIASFAYDLPVPILDANVKRILYRFFARTYATPNELWALSYAFFDAARPYAFNQAMMDLGAMICTPKPSCQLCPLRLGCLGSDEGPGNFPAKKNKKVVPVKEFYLLIYTHEEKLALQQRTEDFLHGLWGFPTSEVCPEVGVYKGLVVHKYSHFHVRAKVYVVPQNTIDVTWVGRDEIEGLALSTLDHKALGLYETI